MLKPQTNPLKHILEKSLYPVPFNPKQGQCSKNKWNFYLIKNFGQNLIGIFETNFF